MYGDSSGGFKISLVSSGSQEQLSAAFEVNFTLAHALENTHVHFHFRARFQSGFDATDAGSLLVGLDETHQANVTTIPGTTTATSFTGAGANFGHIAAGTHTLKIGSHMAQAVSGNAGASFITRFDKIVISGSFAENVA